MILIHRALTPLESDLLKAIAKHVPYKIDNITSCYLRLESFDDLLKALRIALSFNMDLETVVETSKRPL